jgi:hypothetical protein
MKTKQFLVLFLLIAPLSGCVSEYAAQGTPVAKMTFEHVQSFPVDVAAYDVRDEFGSFQEIDEEDMHFVTSPGRVVSDYFRSRFAPAGENGKLIVSVESARVEREVFVSENRVGALMGVGKTDMYKISVHVRLLSYDAGGYDQKEMKMVARRNVGVSEHVSLAQRERLQMEALDSLLDDLDAAVQKALHEEFHLLH